MHIDADDLIAYQEGRLPAEHWPRVEAHLAVCADCALDFELIAAFDVMASDAVEGTPLAQRKMETRQFQTIAILQRCLSGFALSEPDLGAVIRTCARQIQALRRPLNLRSTVIRRPTRH